ncbi:MAG: recombination protein O N-terminal domain-containing protein [Candidatus Paceibacterota bacterium]
MSHVKYTTDAFVIASKEHGEADRIFKLYTKDFGMIFAIAKGVRHLKSKLNPHLGIGGRVKISLVKGKEFWRLIEAVKYDEDNIPVRSRKHFAKIMAVVSRLVHGEEKNPEVYNSLLGLYKALFGLPLNCLEGLELIASTKILSGLGYSGSEELFKTIYQSSFCEEDAVLALGEKSKIILMVNKALTHSHL